MQTFNINSEQNHCVYAPDVFLWNGPKTEFKERESQINYVSIIKVANYCKQF